MAFAQRAGRGRGPSPLGRAVAASRLARQASPIPTKEGKGAGLPRAQRAEGIASKLPRIAQNRNNLHEGKEGRRHYQGAQDLEGEEEDLVEAQLRRAHGFVLPPNQKLLQDMITKMLEICADFRQIKQIVNPVWSAKIESRLEKLEESMRENEENDAAQQERMIALEKMLEAQDGLDEEQEEKLQELEQKLFNQNKNMDERLKEGEDRDREAELQALEREAMLQSRLTEGEERDREAELKAQQREKNLPSKMTGKALLGAVKGAVGANPTPNAALGSGEDSAQKPEGGKVTALNALSSITTKRSQKQGAHARFMNKVAERAQANQSAAKATKDKLEDLQRAHDEQKAQVQRLLDEHERSVEPLKVLVQSGGKNIVAKLLTDNEQLQELLAQSQRGQMELARHVIELQKWQAEAKEQLAAQRREVYGSLEVAAEEHDQLKADFGKLQVTVSQIAGKLAYLIHT